MNKIICGDCLEVCGYDGLVKKDDGKVDLTENCFGCGACAEKC